MNQILYTEDQKKEKGPLGIKTVAKIFAISCIIFGIIICTQGVIAMVNPANEVGTSEPLVQIAQTDNTLNVSVSHDKIIDKIVYSWNKQSEMTLLGKGRMQLEEKLDVPVGNNVLVLKVIDINGKTVTYSSEYIGKQGDIIAPEIELENPVEQKVKIIVKDETALKYVAYHWNQEDETKIPIREDNKKVVEEKIDILKGENTLTIIAVDEAGNESTKEQIYKGATKPKVTTSRDGNNLIIKVVDEEEIQRIDYVLNGTYYSSDASNTGLSLGIKELEVPQPLSIGENAITITVYNVSGLKTEISVQENVE